MPRYGWLYLSPFDAVRRFVDAHPVVSRLPLVKAVIDARLQLRE
jgi:hypothetical protein